MDENYRVFVSLWRPILYEYEEHKDNVVISRLMIRLQSVTEMDGHGHFYIIFFTGNGDLMSFSCSSISKIARNVPAVIVALLLDN